MLRYKFRDALYNALDSYFYLDTPSNARKNDMSITSRHEDAIAKRFVEHTLRLTFTKGIFSFVRISKLILDNGGRVAGLDDAKLTHVVLDKRDDTRRRELMKRTSK
jgi:DNA ligase 4